MMEKDNTPKSIEILGEKYKIKYGDRKTDAKLIGANAYVELYSKEIVLDRLDEEPNTIKNMDWYRRKVIRHEIIHAFLHESGMREWAENEVLVDFIALQYPKLFEIFSKLEIEK